MASKNRFISSDLRQASLDRYKQTCCIGVIKPVNPVVNINDM